MKKFPSAKQAAALTPKDLELWSLEQELKEIKKQIFWAILTEKDYIIRLTLRNNTKSFLIEQGYYIVEDHGYYVIYWAFNPEKLKDKDVNKDFKKYATGGVVNYSSICTKDEGFVLNNNDHFCHLDYNLPNEDRLKELAEKLQNKKFDNMVKI